MAVKGTSYSKSQWRNILFCHGWHFIFALISFELVFIYFDFGINSHLFRLDNFLKEVMIIIPIYKWSNGVFSGGGLTAVSFFIFLATSPLKILFFSFSKFPLSKRQARIIPDLIDKNIWGSTAIIGPIFDGMYKNILSTLAISLASLFAIFVGPPSDYASRANLTKPGVVGGGVTLLAAKYKIVFILLINGILFFSFYFFLLFLRSLVDVFNGGMAKESRGQVLQSSKFINPKPLALDPPYPHP